MGFDVSDALVMTAGGATMAFMVLVLLTTLTAIMGRAVRWWLATTSRQAARLQQPGPPSEEELEMAAAIAVSVVTSRLVRRGPQTGGRPLMGVSASPVSWSVQGRRDIMNSRSVRPRRRQL